MLHSWVRVGLGIGIAGLLAGCGNTAPRKGTMGPVTHLPLDRSAPGTSAAPAKPAPTTASRPSALPAAPVVRTTQPPARTNSPGSSNAVTTASISKPAPAPGSNAPMPDLPAGLVSTTPATEAPRNVSTSSGWISFDSWTSNNGMPKPERSIVHATNIVYRLKTDAGTLALTVNSKLLSWNGVTCWLGYAPMLVENRLLIHALDARKTLEPLMQAHPLESKPGRVVVIDPGHGGENPGAQNITDHHWEKEFTLDWARRLQDLLEHQGWIVYLTRTEDSDMSLPARVEMAERLKADLFISLHFNSATPHKEPTGIETYCVTPMGLPSSLVREGRDDLAADLPSNAHDTDNLQLADRLQRSLIETTGAADRGVKRARFMGVLSPQTRPAVLIEGGFLSNPTEGKRIATAAYRQKLAEAVAKALE